jgi:hypothetical protein
VPVESAPRIGNSRKRYWNVAPIAAVATAPSCPTIAKVAALPLARTSCSTIPGHASSIAARRGVSLASSTARALGGAPSSSATGAGIGSAVIASGSTSSRVRSAVTLRA